MSVDRSLKSRSALTRHRNVLKRDERIDVLTDEDNWHENKDSVFGLPKVAHRKSGAGKKAKKIKDKADEAAAEGKTE
ncbi:MAG: small basic protein [Sedimentisphaerales bacterium]|nr:small basic protein [Sedimentisphaerales bacterium]